MKLIVRYKHRQTIAKFLLKDQNYVKRIDFENLLGILNKLTIFISFADDM